MMSEKVTIRKKHALAIRWFHWVNFPVLAVMVWSGMLIYWAYDPYKVKVGSLTLVQFWPDSWYEALGIPFRLAEGMSWHFALMWLFLLNGMLYVLYTGISGEWRELLPNKRSFKEAWHVLLHDLRIRKGPLPEKKFNGAQQIAYTSIIFMGMGSVLTGIAIYKPTQLAWITWIYGGYETARLLHFALTIGYCLFFLVHIAQVVRAGWNNFQAMVTGWERVRPKPEANTAAPSPINAPEQP